MFLFNEILLSHTFNRIIFLIFFVLAQHNLSESSSSQYFQQLKLLETIDVILVALAFENNLALCFYLIILLDAFCV